jgi:hypothetical protein
MLRKNKTAGSMTTAGINFIPRQMDLTPPIQIKEEPQEEDIFRPPKPIKKAKQKFHRDK